MVGEQDGADKKKPVTQERLREEYELSARFYNVFQNRLDEIRRSGDAKSFQLEGEERELLLRVNNLGLKEGVAGGLLALVLLRRVRTGFLTRLLLKRDKMAMNHQQQQGGYGGGGGGGGGGHVQNSPFARQQQQPQQQLTPPPSSSSTSGQYTALDNAIRQRENPFSFVNIFGWVLDTTVAFSVAVTTALVFTDKGKILDTLTDIPLTSGRSRVAEEFCPPVLLEFERCRDENRNNNKNLLDDPQSPYLAAIAQFTQNCRRRALLENQLRREQGLGAGAPVSVPPPGVPAAAAASDVEHRYDDYNNDFGAPHGDGDSFYDPSADDADFGSKRNDGASSSNNWADSFVTDQEEEDDRRK